MKVCPVCQSRYDDASGFCRRDGAALVPDRAVAPEVLARRELLEQRLSQEPENPALFEELGDLLASVPLHEEALVQLFKALELDPEREAVRRKIAEVYRARADWPGAAKHLEVLAEAHPADLELLEALAAVYEKAGRRPEAADLYGRMAELAPGDSAVWSHWRDLLLATRRDRQLGPVYRRLTELEPAVLAHWLDLAARLVAEQSGAEEEWARIEARLARAVGSGEAASGQRAAKTRLYLTVARLRLGTATSDARSLFLPVEPRDLDPSDASLAAECLAEVGELALGQGLAEEAFGAFTLSLRFHPARRARESLARIHADRAAALLGTKRFRGAMEECDRGLAQASEDPTLLALRGRAVGARRVRVGLAVGGVLLALVAGAAWFFHSRGGGLLGQKPVASDLVAAFGAFLREQEGVRDFKRGDGGRELSFKIGEDQWRVTLDRPSVSSTNDDTGAFRGTVELRWEKNGAAVTSRKGLPAVLQKTGLGPKAGDARYNKYKKRWKW